MIAKLLFNLAEERVFQRPYIPHGGTGDPVEWGMFYPGVIEV
jgi:hypothetical protein